MQPTAWTKSFDGCSPQKSRSPVACRPWSFDQQQHFAGVSWGILGYPAVTYEIRSDLSMIFYGIPIMIFYPELLAYELPSGNLT